MKTSKRMLEWAGMIIPLLLAMGCLAVVCLNHLHSSNPTPMPQELVGEYSYDKQTWLPITEDADLSALKGDLYLRGHFLYSIPSGANLVYYRNHIGVQIWVDGETFHRNEIMRWPDMDKGLFTYVCAREWVRCAEAAISNESLIEVRLHNPHRWGNEDAYREFLATLCAANNIGSYLQTHLKTYGEPHRVVGTLLVAMSFLLLGGAVAAFVQRLPLGITFFKLGLLALFAGGYIAYDTLDLSFWVELNVFGTYGKLLCMMLAVFFLQQLISDALVGGLRTVGKLAVLASGVISSVLILLSFAGVTVLYDTLPYWAAVQGILCPLFIGLCGAALCRKGANRFVLISVMLMCAAILLDLAGVGHGIARRSPCAKIVFVVLAAAHIVNGVRMLIRNYLSSLRTSSLEKELEDSRVAITLSQIQPHFLFNVLNTIYQLYDVEPKAAKDATLKFAEYLRSNMLAIEMTEPILFEKEYHHIQTYLSLEKVRFGKKLNVVYDPQVTNFKLPPLSIQPLVENAVKHGVTKKRGGGTVTISTRETQDSIVITVADTGKGFDPTQIYDDGEAHVGIRNVRRRLQLMMGGTLAIDSTPDVGTTAVVTLPKKEATMNHENHSR